MACAAKKDESLRAGAHQVGAEENKPILDHLPDDVMICSCSEDEGKQLNMDKMHKCYIQILRGGTRVPGIK